MKTPQRTLLAAAIAFALASGSTHAELARMGPISNDPTIGGVPTWYQDKTGLALDFCSLLNQAELNGGWCVLIPPGLSFPETFPTSYFPEHFYYAANNGMKDAATGTSARLVIALEAAFANNVPVAGDQMVFGRHRVFITNLPADGDYRVITPYKNTLYPGMKAGDRIFDTEDIGIACVGTFDCALGASVGPWLLPSPVAGGDELPPIPDLQAGLDPFYDALVVAGGQTAYPGTGKKYLADPARIGPVRGSPLPVYVDAAGVAHNPNTFRVEGPNGWVLDGENNFTISGRVMTTAIPGQVSVDRASYTRDAAGVLQHVDVFAKAAETQPARLPAAPIPPTTVPVLSFFDVPCLGAIGTHPVTGLPAVLPPPYQAPAAPEIPMNGAGSNYWAQSQPTVLPSHVCVKDATARNALGQIVPAYFLEAVRDDVTITSASFNTSGTLSIQAVSSDQTAALTAAALGPNGTGLPLVAGNASVPGLLAPPSKVQVASSGGGSTVAPVLTSTGSVQLPGEPVAVSSSVTTLEDTPVSPPLNPLATAQNAVGGKVTITQVPALGTAVVNADQTISYTPVLNMNGTDAIGYTISTVINGTTHVSNQAAITITITPVNDPPVALTTDTGSAVINKANVLNLIAKATDPDGNGDIKNAVIATWPPQLGATVPAPNAGVITYTPTATGTFPITYQVTDTAGALSNIGTVNVTVLAAEAIAFTKSIFKGAGKIGGAASTRWTVSGTDTAREGQTLTIAYLDGKTTAAAGGVTCDANTSSSPTACIIGTAVVDALGNFLFDQVGTPGGLLDPNDTATWAQRPSNIKVYSSSPALGGFQRTGISFK